MAQTWVDYQFRHPGKYPSFRYAVDEEWARLYRTVLKNKEKGGEFEQAVLKARGHEKNTALLLPPPGHASQGFIPDAVVGSPDELLTQPLRKRLRDLSRNGNARIDYFP